MSIAATIAAHGFLWGCCWGTASDGVEFAGRPSKKTGLWSVSALLMTSSATIGGTARRTRRRSDVHEQILLHSVCGGQTLPLRLPAPAHWGPFDIAINWTF